MFVAAWFVACGGEKDTQSDTDADTDSDTDADTDSDTDADTDSDTDTDTDTDTDAHTGTPGTELLWDSTRVLVVPHGEGLTFFASDGSTVLDESWSTLLGSCSRCGGEGAADDGDGLLLSITTNGPTSGGAVARLDNAGALEWRVDGFGFPHDAERDPADDTVIVPEVNGSEVRWIPGDGSSDDGVRYFDRDTPDWPGGLPNGAEKLEWNGGTYLLLSHRGLVSPFAAEGYLTFWDISSPSNPFLVWQYPASGNLRTPHGAVFRRFDGHLWLVYAHTEGTNPTGTVGLAWADDPLQPPQYVADLAPDGDSFSFLRGVEITADLQMWLTDSGPGAGASTSSNGRILQSAVPAGLTPATESGAFGDLNVVTFTPSLFADGLVNPFEGWLWQNTFP